MVYSITFDDFQLIVSRIDLQLANSLGFSVCSYTIRRSQSVPSHRMYIYNKQLKLVNEQNSMNEIVKWYYFIGLSSVFPSL